MVTAHGINDSTVHNEQERINVHVKQRISIPIDPDNRLRLKGSGEVNRAVIHFQFFELFLIGVMYGVKSGH
jgi:hypothetical protein